jgi:pimeloyl-ACP methyl ester carboxylesterase
MPLIVFSHANSFPAGTYRLMFRSLRARGFAVVAVEKFGHDPSYPVSSNWRHLVRQLADFAQVESIRHPGPVFLVGHSLGGLLSLMCAARHPLLGDKPVQGVVLLDSPLLGGWRAQALSMLKSVQWMGSVSPGRISRRRRDHWPSAKMALEHFASKTLFKRWDPRVLADYVAQGTHDVVAEDGSKRRALSFDRDIETAIYNTLPDNLDSLLRRHPLKCPVGFIGGDQSSEMQQVGLSMTYQVVGRQHPDRLMMVEGSHLFPMERPLETAAAIEQMIKRLVSVNNE